MVFDRHKERTRLRELKVSLEADLADVDKMLAVLEGKQPGSPPVQAARSVETAQPVRVKGKKGLKVALREILADGQRRSVKDVIEAVQATGDFDELPKRVTFTNRLNDLVHEGYIESPSRGIYQLAAPDDGVLADAQSLIANGSPHPASDEEKPSPSMSAHGGGGTAMEGAPGVAHRTRT